MISSSILNIPNPRSIELDHFDCELVARGLVDGRVNFSKGSIAYLFTEMHDILESRGPSCPESGNMP